MGIIKQKNCKSLKIKGHKKLNGYNKFYVINESTWLLVSSVYTTKLLGGKVKLIRQLD